MKTRKQYFFWTKIVCFSMLYLLKYSFFWHVLSKKSIINFKIVLIWKFENLNVLTTSYWLKIRVKFFLGIKKYINWILNLKIFFFIINKTFLNAIYKGREILKTFPLIDTKYWNKTYFNEVLKLEKNNNNNKILNNIGINK